MKKIFFTLLLLTFVIASVSGQPRKDRFVLKTVVIDAGHGGHDPGTCFGKYQEKTIVLDVALKLGKMINKKFPDVKVVYTRKDDTFIPLIDRGKIANKSGGDLFISIHVNSTGKANSAQGTETFTLGLHKSEANLEIAKKENSVIMLEDNFEKSYEGFDPKDPESYIMFELVQYGYSMLSISYAHLVEESFKRNNVSTVSRGIKQSGFLVLWYTSMPSILTELGFLNHSSDRAKLITEEGRVNCAKSLFEAFRKYKESVETESSYTPSNNENIKDKLQKGAGAKYNLVARKADSKGYCVQIFTSGKRIAINKAKFGDYAANVFELKVKNSYKYLLGVLNNYEESLSLREEVSRGMFKDAYIVGIVKNEIKSVSEMKRILKK